MDDDSWVSNLFEAVEKGNVESLNILLKPISRKDRANIVSKKLNGSTMLNRACLMGFTKIVEYLIETCKADLNCFGDEIFNGDSLLSYSPLHCATYAKHTQIVKYLIGKKVNINATNKNNETILKYIYIVSIILLFILKPEIGSKLL